MSELRTDGRTFAILESLSRLKNSLNWVGQGFKTTFFSKQKCGQRFGVGGSETYLFTFKEVV